MIRLKKEAAGCNFDLEQVRWLPSEELECVECGHRMPVSAFPRSDRVLHGAVDQAREVYRASHS